MPEKCVIKVENNDCKIWNIEAVIIDLVDAIHKDLAIEVFLHNEGPCAESLGLYALLDKICNKFNYPKQKISIRTNNLIEYHSEYNIKIVPPVKHISDLQQQLKVSPVDHKQITDSTKHFGNFVGHGNRIRLELGSYLWKHYKDKTLQTYHCVPTDSYHREFVGLEDMWFHNYGIESVERSVKFLQQTPFTFDDISFYPILDKKMYNIQDAYQYFFVDIAYSTFFTGNVFYMDEKLWRPIITKTPFILHGPVNTLSNLQKLGFQTFDRWWDEGYGEDPPDYQVKSIKENIDSLSTKSIAELEQMYEEMKPVLDHNYKLFMNLTEKQFLQVDYVRDSQ